MRALLITAGLWGLLLTGCVPDYSRLDARACSTDDDCAEGQCDRGYCVRQGPCDGDFCDRDGDGTEDTADCAPLDAAIYPSAPEICDDGKDNDCDEVADNADSDCAIEICTDDLSNLGDRDFRVRFRLATAQTGVVQLLAQRFGCGSAPQYWDIRLVQGQINVETQEEGGLRNELRSTRTVNDGVPRDIIVERRLGALTITIDCELDAAGPAIASFGPLPPMASDGGCVGTDATRTLTQGTLSEVCVSRADDGFLIDSLCPIDSDEDGILDRDDNCPDIPNPTQNDRDGDRSGDACDLCLADPDDILDEDGFCAQGACAPASCAEIHALDPNAQSGIYALDPLRNCRVIDAFCDMKTDGGGWTRVLGIVNPDNETKTPANPQRLHDGIAAAASGTGHALPSALRVWRAQDGFSEMRFECLKTTIYGSHPDHTAPGRKVHIKTRDTAVLDFFTNHNVPFPEAPGSFVRLDDDTSVSSGHAQAAQLPDPGLGNPGGPIRSGPEDWGSTTDNRFFFGVWGHPSTLQSDRQFTASAFFIYSTVNWQIGAVNLYECDDQDRSEDQKPEGAWFVWVR